MTEREGLSPQPTVHLPSDRSIVRTNAPPREHCKCIFCRNRKNRKTDVSLEKELTPFYSKRGTRLKHATVIIFPKSTKKFPFKGPTEPERVKDAFDHIINVHWDTSKILELLQCGKIVAARIEEYLKVYREYPDSEAFFQLRVSEDYMNLTAVEEENKISKIKTKIWFQVCRLE